MSRSFAKLLMIVSALFLFVAGLALTFAPDDMIHRAGGVHGPLLTPLAQVCGALFLGFAILNWMAKDNLIGGIYSRPVAMGNFLHFFVVAMALVKSFSGLPHSLGLGALLAFYVSFAVGFGLVILRHPKTDGV